MTLSLFRACALGAGLVASTGAFASQADCDLVARSMLAVTEQPSVRQAVTTNGKETGPTSILLTDAMHVQTDPNGKWVRMPIDAAARRKMVEMGLKALPLSDCKVDGSRTVNDVGVDAYSYKQPDPLKPGQMSQTTILIGADGLPRRLDLLDGQAMVFQYGDFKAPTP